MVYGNLMSQARMTKSEELGVNLHFNKILLKECLPLLEAPPPFFIPLLSRFENPLNKSKSRQIICLM